MRTATAEDAEAVGVVTEASYRDHVGDPGYLAQLRDAGPRIRDSEVIVTTLDGVVVASVVLAVPGNPYAEISRTDELEVRMLAVAEAARGQGIADRLMSRVEGRALELELHAVVLSTAPTMSAARRLYERRGYERQPDRDWPVAEDMTLLVYRLALTT